MRKRMWSASEKFSFIPMEVKSNTDIETNSQEAANADYFQAILSSAAYATTSVSMVLINKFIAQSVPPSYREQIPNLVVIWMQCLIAVILLEVARFMKYIEYPQLQWSIVKVWIPVNIIFIGMLATGFVSFIYLSVPMINIMKNLTNVMTVGGDWLLYNET